MSERIVVVTGGVGGAKLVLGLCHAAPPASIDAIVNTGDDFRHLGLYVSPDIDTLLYTLSGKSNETQGWGRAGESWAFMDAVRSLGGEDWFALGDGDLALHVLRSERLARGEKLSSIIRAFAAAWGIEASILPKSDDAVATMVETDEGLLEFQDYFVRRRCAPVVRKIEYRGAERAAAGPGVVEAIASAEAIIIAPSNPYLSVAPILAVPEIRRALANAQAPRVVVSPIVGGEAVKGPTAKIMRELGLAVTNASILAAYEGLIDGIVVNGADETPDGPLRVLRTDTMMRTLSDKTRLAAETLAFARSLAGA